MVVGRRLQAVPEAEALGGIFGYTAANDISARGDPADKALQL